MIGEDPAGTCPVCKKSGAKFHRETSLHRGVRCTNCGDFIDFIPEQLQLDELSKIKVSGYIRDQNVINLQPEINYRTARVIVSLPAPKLQERADRLLSFAIRKFGIKASLTASSIPDFDGAAASTYSAPDETQLLANMLVEEGLFALRGGLYLVTPKGFVAFEGQNDPRSLSPQAFVAMSFDPTMLPTYLEGFAPALKAAGYRPLRIDNKEHASSISDEILSEIRRSRFLVADYTMQNNGVYFEAGFAQGLGIQVIPTCRADELSKLHFDIRHINTVGWTDAADLAIKLSRRVSAVMGDGPLERAPLA